MKEINGKFFLENDENTTSLMTKTVRHQFPSLRKGSNLYFTMDGKSQVMFHIYYRYSVNDNFDDFSKEEVTYIRRKNNTLRIRIGRYGDKRVGRIINRETQMNDPVYEYGIPIGYIKKEDISDGVIQFTYNNCIPIHLWHSY